MKRASSIFILVSFVIIVIYDIIAASLGWPTISYVILNWAQEHLTIPFGTGILCGHFFWPANFSRFRRILSLVLLIASSLTILVLDILGYIPEAPMVVGCLLGIIAGHYGWSQTKE